MRTILVVEDERIVAKDLQQSLIALGYAVPATAASAEDALRLAAEHVPDLVLMDVRIKGERDGIETAGILHRDFDVPVVYLTAYADEDTIARAKATNPHGYLLKPVKPGELRSTVEIALHKHEMDRRLREREQWTTSTLKSIGDAVIATDPSGSITYMNSIAEVLTGKRLEHVQGQRLADVIGLVDERTGETVENPIARALREGKIASVPAALRTDKGERSIDDTASPILDDKGAILGAVMVFRDTTEQREAERQIVQSDRLSSLATMAAGVAHEINNPLAVVVANAALAAQELGEVQRELGKLQTTPDIERRLIDVQAMIKDIQQSADRVAGIVTDLRTFSRPRDEGPMHVDVREPLEWAIRITENQLRPRARLIRDLAPVPMVVAVQARMGQAFVNLLVHAIHTLAERPRERNEIRVTTEFDGTHVIVTIGDNGPGLAPDARARIFEPFFSTRKAPDGVNLGLAVTHGIVKSLGGTIEVESALGVGTTFRVVFRAAPSEYAAPSLSEEPTTERRGHLIIIDDEPLLLNSLTRVLSRDHDVVAFTDPEAALELIAKRRDVDMILCDLIMPRVTGMEIYERILKIAPDLARRVVFVTGGAFTTRSKEFLASVKNPCLEKPFGPDRLRAFVRDFLAKA